MTTEILFNIVYELNNDFYEQTNMDECCPFKISSDGDWIAITFMDEYIWGSEDDPREYTDDGNEYHHEPLDKYLRRIANKMVYELLKLKF